MRRGKQAQHMGMFSQQHGVCSRDMVKKRSQGLFFKSLFQEKRGKPKRLVDSLDALAKPEVRLWLLSVAPICGLNAGHLCLCRHCACCLHGFRFRNMALHK